MPDIWYAVREGALLFLRLAQLAILAYAVLSWFMDSRQPVMRFLTKVTDPILQPIRMLLFRGTHTYYSGSFAPLVALLIIQLLSGWLMRM